MEQNQNSNIPSNNTLLFGGNKIKINLTYSNRRNEKKETSNIIEEEWIKNQIAINNILNIKLIYLQQ